jgi:radical SAM superfamily enzyme YgiQ (UPF0313 family)
MVSKVLAPPLGLAMVASLTPPDIEVSLTDERVTAIDFHNKPDLVGITVLTVTAQRAYEIADAFRTKGVKVILGGVHPTLLPDEASQHADAVVIGEAEGIWLKVIDDFKANRLKKIYRQQGRPSLINLPLPRRDLFAKGAYFVPNTISTTRGCPFSCTFCSVTSFFGRSYRCRPVAEIIKEIETFENKDFIAFVDDNIAGNPRFARELFAALISYQIKWIAQASVTVAKDDELLKLAATSGCIDLLIGFETLSPANLASMGKKINVVNQYEEVIKKIHSHGIAVHGFFIFGLDGDDAGVFKKTVRWAQKMRLESAQFDILVPYPGTAIYQSMHNEGRILTKDWTQYGYNLVFKLQSMSPERLKEGHAWAWQQFYSMPSIWRRIGLGRPHWTMLWKMNLLYWSHLRRKRRNYMGNRFISANLS